jgi:type IV secretory pathway VirJ component
MLRTAGVLLVLVGSAARADALSSEKLDISIRGQTLTISIYKPHGPARGTIVMGSGDVGWVGLAVALAEDFSKQGYLIVGINVRQYLASYTSGKAHVQTTDVPADYRTICDRVRQRETLTRPLVLSGVSEGAALAVLAASEAKNHDWIDGVITMGLPATAELAWRWTDIGAWITKRDANEPSFSPADVIARVSPLPLCMIQSKKDEYVLRSDYEKLLATAREPKRLTLIDASNHRFTDKPVELRRAFTDGLTWIHASRGEAMP